MKSSKCKLTLLLSTAFFLLSPVFPNVSFAASAQAATCGYVPKQGVNPTYQQINCLLTQAAIKAKIPPEVVKGIATQESGDWKQFDANGKPIISPDGGIGVMQITNQTGYDTNKLKNDVVYNINAGVEIVANMYKRNDLPNIKGMTSNIIENWYFPVMAYNGTKPKNSPIVQATGKKNMNAYQEKVFHHIEEFSFLDSMKLTPIPFLAKDFQYDPQSNENIKFLKTLYTITKPLNASRYSFMKGEAVVTTQSANLRSKPTTDSSSVPIKKQTTLTIAGNFTYDEVSSRHNQFVWYPVKPGNSTKTYYISSSYITKKLNAPSVNTVDDNDKYVTGSKALPGSNVTVKAGTKGIGAAIADAKGSFKLSIPIQKANSSLTIYYVDKTNTQSPAATVKVKDRTAPSAPKINSITSKTKSVTGKAESYSTVKLAVGKKTIGAAKADQKGNVKISIKPQKAGTLIKASATDTSGNTSSITTIKVKK